VVASLGTISAVRDLERELFRVRALLSSSRSETESARARAQQAERALEHLAATRASDLEDGDAGFYVAWAWVRLLSWLGSAACAYWAAFWWPAGVVPVAGLAIHAAMVLGVYRIQTRGA
jgi:fatty acid desaturase